MSFFAKLLSCWISYVISQERGLSILSEDFPSEAIFNVASCEGLPIVEGIPEVVILSDDILLDEGLFREGSSGVVIFSAVIMDEDGIIVRSWYILVKNRFLADSYSSNNYLSFGPN